jgi:hypothetical protein
LADDRAWARTRRPKLAKLQEAGLVDLRRGGIKVLDVHGLRAAGQFNQHLPSSADCNVPTFVRGVCDTAAAALQLATPTLKSRAASDRYTEVYLH